MQDLLPLPIANLIEAFGRLPGIGPKSAQRLAFHLIGAPEGEVKELVNALLRSKSELMLCASCFTVTDKTLCHVCSDPMRDHSMICVVQDTKDMLALERMRVYHGLYHVLGGVLSPMDGIGPDELQIRSLLQRLTDESVKELILATNSTMEGEATATFIARLAKPFETLSVTRIAHGIPIGGDLDYADEATLSRALEFRPPI